MKPTHRSPARIALLIATLALLLSTLACGGGIIPNCTDAECALSAGGCLICQGVPATK